jgi:Cu-processing system permease protein
LKQVLWLSRLVLLGNLRRQVHLGTLLLAVLLLMLPSYIEAFSLGMNAFERVSKDFGLAAISYFSVAMAVLLGSTTLRQDLESRSLYTLLARPVSRGVYLAAHLLGLLIMLGISLLLLGGCLTLALGIKTERLDSGVSLAVYGAFWQACLVGAFCLLASLRCSPPLAGTIGVAVYLIGNLSDTFIKFFLLEDRGSVASATLARGLKTVLPDLGLFSLNDCAVHGLSLPAGYLAAVSYYGVAWLVFLVLLARLIFQRLDL